MEISRLSDAQKHHERTDGNAAEKSGKNLGKPGPPKRPRADPLKKQATAEKTIERIRPSSGSEKTVKRKGERREKNHRRRAKGEMVRAAGKFGKKHGPAALNHARSGAEVVFLVRNRRRAEGAREAGKDRRRSRRTPPGS